MYPTHGLEHKSRAKIRGLWRGIQTETVAWSQEAGASLLLCGFVFVLAVYTLTTMAIIDFRGYSVLPWGDMWDYWILYLRLKGHPIAMLAAQHNEHRIAVPRLFFLADQVFFHARAIFICACIFVIQLLHALLLSRLAYLSQLKYKTTPAFLMAAAFICSFSALQYTNFTWSFQIQFVAVYFAVTAALASLMTFARRSSEGPLVSTFRGPRLWLYVAVVMGFIATYSMANGLLVWLLLLSTAYWFGVARREKATLLAVSIVAWTLYLWDYRTPPQHSSIFEGLLKFPKSVAYAMCVLGSPLNGILSAISRTFIRGENRLWIWSAAAGLIGLILGCALWFYFLSDRVKPKQAQVVMLHMLLFVIATVFLIGLGRVNFPLEDALQSRYTTPALLFWFCVLFLLSSLLEENSPVRKHQPFLIFQFVSTVILVLVIALYQPTQIQYAHDATVYESETEAAISAPVYDQEIWRRIYYNPEGMIPAVQYLRSNHLSVFALKRSKWLGDPITAHYEAVEAKRCTGFFDNASLIEDQTFPGVRAEGWSWDLKLQQAAESIVFTDGRGQIVGFGYTGFERSDVPKARSDIASAAVGWKGYIAGLENDVIAAYMVTDAGRSSCSIGTRKATRFSAAAFEQLGEPLADVPVEIHGAWVRDGYYPGSERPPVETKVMGSWVKGDADTGTLRLGPFRTGTADAIALPVLTGPVSRGLSIVAIDSSSGNTLAELSPPPVLLKWRVWKILLPKHDMHLEIVAQDQGSEWGEWLAVGMPHTLE